MAAVSLQLAAVFQETVTINPAQGNANGTPVNANQAQGAPAPQDTVTLTAQAPQGQQTQQNPQQQPQIQETILFAAEAQIVAPAGPGNTAANTGQTQAVATPAAQPATPQQDPLAGLLGNAANGNTANATPTADQELQTLDATLQQLGVNPDSISLFNRLALLLYANDPAALQQFIQQLQQAAHPAGQAATTATTATTAANNPATAPTTTAPAQAQGATAAQATPAAQTAPNQPFAPNLASGLSFQFEEFQLTFAAIAGGGAPFAAVPNSPAQNSNAAQGGAQLNVIV